jgi:hypothetical protein
MGEKALKYTFCYYSALVLQQQPPDYESLPLLFYGGIVRRRVKRYAERGSVRRFGIAQAFLMMKRGCAVVSDRFTCAAVEKTVKKLTTVDSSPEPYWFGDEIDRTVAEIFPTRYRPTKQMLVPSIRGCFSRFDSCLGKRNTLGSLGLFQTTLPTVLRYLPCELISIVCRLDKTVEIRDHRFIIEERLADWLQAQVRLDDEFPGCVPIPVRESLKVRVITKGPPGLHYGFRYLQKFLWDCLQRHPTFVLTGRPLELSDLDRLYSRMPLWAKICSGDYADATNELKKWATERTWNSISDRLWLTDETERLGYKCLTQHKVVTDPLNPELCFLDQQKAQLMGSPLSFILLCVINAAGTRRAMEVAYEREFTLIETGMLVNGDDILFHIPEESYPLWIENQRLMGLIMSPGKNYLSSTFAVINSRMYRRTNPFEAYLFGHWFTEVTFVNPGLLLGTGRTARSDDADKLDGLVSRCHDLLKVVDSTQRDFFIHLFVRLNGDRLKAISAPSQSWWLPAYAGGLGLPVPSDISIQDCSPTARRVCRYLCNSADLVTCFEACQGIEAGFLEVGLQRVGDYDRSLGLKPKKCTFDDENAQYSDAYVHSFFPFITVEGFRKKNKDNPFLRIAAKARKAPECIGFPKLERFVYRPSMDYLCKGTGLLVQLLR